MSGKWKALASVGLLAEIKLDNHHIRLYEDRLAIWRSDGERMSWDELQGVKQEVWGDRIAIEVYPPQALVVNLRNTRHLWSSFEIENAVRHSCRHPEFEKKCTE